MSELNRKLNVLVFGSGAREHSIALEISKSPFLNKLFLAQAGTFELGEIINFCDFEQLARKCVLKKINLAVFGPEEPLCEGIVDIFRKYKIPTIGVDKNFSQLESSKLFAKNFMAKHGVKTAEYYVIASDAKQSKICFEYPSPQPSPSRGEGELNSSSPVHLFTCSPTVIKADGLCKGKGVVIVHDEKKVGKIIEDLRKNFGKNAQKILIEEFLQGEEISLISLWDGEEFLHFPPARDFKKLNNSKNAPNTGGMGAFCPVLLTKEQQKKLDAYKKQLQNALIKEKADFVGFIYSGLIWAQKGKICDWHVLEYNVRIGDPECQAILTHLKSDFLEILYKASKGKLKTLKPSYKKNTSACLVIACKGYPQKPKDGEEIVIEKQKGVQVYYAGVEKKGKKLFSKGGRVLSLCANAKEPFGILKEFAKTIKMKYKYFREDIVL